MSDSEKSKIKVSFASALNEIPPQEADSVLLPAQQGDILILPNRAPLFILLKCGKVVLKNNKESKIVYISSGISEIRHNTCPVCAWFVEESQASVSQAQQQISLLQEELTKAHSALQKTQINQRLELWELILKEKNKIS